MVAVVWCCYEGLRVGYEADIVFEVLGCVRRSSIAKIGWRVLMWLLDYQFLSRPFVLTASRWFGRFCWCRKNVEPAHSWWGIFTLQVSANLNYYTPPKVLIKMSFRKRNIVVSSPGSGGLPIRQAEKTEIPGVRPSPLDGRLTTSTGTRSLDTLLAGHAGLPLGTSMLIEESGTTDFSGALLRYFAAEGVTQGHVAHVLGVGDAWARELPGIQAQKKSSEKSTEQKIQGDKMKIAWRYERLGEFGKGALSSSCIQMLAMNYENAHLSKVS